MRLRHVLATGTAASLLFAGVITAAPVHADPGTATISVTSAQTSGDGGVEVVGSYTCASPTVPSIELTIDQGPNHGDTGDIEQAECTGTSLAFDIIVESESDPFEAGSATYEADLDGGTPPAALASESGNVTVVEHEPPSAVNDLTVSGITADTITVSWSQPTDDGGAPIVSYQADLTGGAQTVDAKGITETTHTFKNLDPSTRYKVDVTATNGAGFSGPESEISATTDRYAAGPPKHRHHKHHKHHKPVRRSPQTVTIQVTHHHILKGHLAVFSGRIFPTRRNQIELQRQVHGSWRTVKVRHSHHNGRYRIAVHPHSRYIARVLSLGTKRLLRGRSVRIIVHIVTHVIY